MLAHTVGAIGVGQKATKIWADSHPLLTAFVVPALMTAAILVLSEIIPKTIGAKNWRALAPFTIRSLNILLLVLSPIVWLCQPVTGFFSAGHNESVFNRTDFLAMAQIGSQEGQLNDVEGKFIHNLLHLRTFRVRDIMTPRIMAVSASQDTTAREFYDLQDELVFSRVPLREEADSEVIIGYVLKDEVLEHLIDDDAVKTLAEFRRDILTIPDDYNIFLLFNDFIDKREHIALVTDEYGGMAGIVTMEDVIETLLGAEIVDETDRIVDMQDMARKSWKNRYERLTPAGEKAASAVS